MYPHRIRLRGPWECEPVARVAGDVRPLPPPRRMTLPCRWTDGKLTEFAGVVRFRRRFGYPGRIDAHERVWLTVGPASDRVNVALNGKSLGKQQGGGCEFEVTALLSERNELTVEVEGGETGGLWGEVALEVRCTAYLKNVQCHGTMDADGSAQVAVTGDLCGAAAETLELYLLVDRSTMAYAVVPAPVGGQPLRLASEKITPERWLAGHDGVTPHRVQVDLVQAATVWYRWEQELSMEPPHDRRD